MERDEGRERKKGSEKCINVFPVGEKERNMTNKIDKERDRET